MFGIDQHDRQYQLYYQSRKTHDTLFLFKLQMDECDLFG